MMNWQKKHYGIRRISLKLIQQCNVEYVMNMSLRQ
jgi:hypothetical protein